MASTIPSPWRLVAVLAGCAAALLTQGPAASAFTERVSLGADGRQAGAASRSPSISSDGRYVAFVSEADDLTAGEGPFWDVYVRDRVTGETELVSRPTAGTAANGDSFLPSISDDGRWVAFVSRASNLAAGDTDFHINDVFVRDLDAGTTSLVSAATGFAEPDGSSTQPALSGDGRFVAFTSTSTNLVAGDANGRADVFVRDLVTDTTTLVSVSDSGLQGDKDSSRPAIDARGRSVAFLSHASNLVPLDTNGLPGPAAPTDLGDVFVRDRSSAHTERVSLDDAGREANGLSFSPSISADGRYVAFKSYASNLVIGDDNGLDGVFLRDRQTDTTEQVDVDGAGRQADGASFSGPTSVSADGRFVAFGSSARNLVRRATNGAVQAFRRDRRRGSTQLISVGSTWQQADDGVFGVAMTDEGKAVAFDSFAPLVWRDTNFTSDVFVHVVGPQPAPTCDGAAATMVGTAQDDRITGTPGPDVIVGGGGADRIDGRGGSDTICGDGGGDDRQTADDAPDRLEGGDGDDVLVGQGGADALKGSGGQDVLVGGVGEDTLSGATGDDLLAGSAGADALTGGDGADRLRGDSGPDALDAQGGQDLLWGGSGADRLKGGPGEDRLEGEYGDDHLTGAGGADWLVGGNGADLLEGGDEADSLRGGMADDRLYGDGGDDALDGGTHFTGDLCRQGPGTGMLIHCER